MDIILGIIKLARPQQWVKNIFVFPVLVFSGSILQIEQVILTLVAFAAFCLASSSVYVINGFIDIDEDKKHPIKRFRPLASGSVPKWTGLVGSIVLGGLSLAIPAIYLNPPTVGVVGFYLLLNILYNLGLKHLVIIDVLVIASGFVLRILAGATALYIMPSPWLVLCAVMLSLFLAFTKRRAEILSLGDEAAQHRKVLADYSPMFLDQVISIVTASTVLGYVLYTVDDRTTAIVGSRLLLLSVPFVLYCIFRYLYLIYQVNAEDGNHARTIFTDVPMLISGGIWGILCTVIVLFGNKIGDLLP
ncbi:MAG: decaprenyl-phosphate phosphoribosyltransferase [Proteobacteria bacterium]|nr:decaprenyl-phosphate phosphoribosyltransferase [Pseudomonadota bacterium]